MTSTIFGRRLVWLEMNEYEQTPDQPHRPAAPAHRRKANRVCRWLRERETLKAGSPTCVPASVGPSTSGQGSRRVEPRDHGLEHQAHARPASRAGGKSAARFAFTSWAVSCAAMKPSGRQLWPAGITIPRKRSSPRSNDLSKPQVRQTPRHCRHHCSRDQTGQAGDPASIKMRGLPGANRGRNVCHHSLRFMTATRAYKQFGNSVVVDVMRHVASMMKPALEADIQVPELPLTYKSA